MSGVDSLPPEEFNKVQQLFLWKNQAIGLDRQGKSERQDNKGVKTMKNTSGLAPRILRKKRGRKKQNKLLM